MDTSNRAYGADPRNSSQSAAKPSPEVNGLATEPETTNKAPLDLLQKQTRKQVGKQTP